MADPLAIAAGAGQALGSLFGGDNNQMPVSVQKNLAREQMALQAAPILAALSFRQGTMPMSDQAAYLLKARMQPDAMGGSFQGRDFFNPSTSSAVPRYGGINMDAVQSAGANYTAGAGGLDPSVINDIVQRFRTKYHFTPPPADTTTPPLGPIPGAAGGATGGNPNAAPTGGAAPGGYNPNQTWQQWPRR